jgi:hypothetical protein
MTELLDKRLRFTRNLVTLISRFNQRPNMDIAIGRDFDEQYEKTPAGKPLRHMRSSLHYSGLANDIAVYIDGIYQEHTEAYAELGEFWKSLDPDNRWGGDFKKSDGNHFSITYGGKS